MAMKKTQKERLKYLQNSTLNIQQDEKSHKMSYIYLNADSTAFCAYYFISFIAQSYAILRSALTFKIPLFD